MGKINLSFERIISKQILKLLDNSQHSFVQIYNEFVSVVKVSIMMGTKYWQTLWKNVKIVKVVK